MEYYIYIYSDIFLNIYKNEPYTTHGSKHIPHRGGGATLYHTAGATLYDLPHDPIPHGGCNPISYTLQNTQFPYGYGSIRNTESMIKYLFFISQGVI